MISINTMAGSSHRNRRSRSEILVSKKSIFDRVHRGVQRHRGENTRRFLKYPAEHNARQGRQDHIAPVGHRLRAVVEMRTPENEPGSQQGAIVGAKALHDPVLYQTPKQDLFRERGGATYDEVSTG